MASKYGYNEDPTVPQNDAPYGYGRQYGAEQGDPYYTNRQESGYYSRQPRGSADRYAAPGRGAPDYGDPLYGAGYPDGRQPSSYGAPRQYYGPHYGHSAPPQYDGYDPRDPGGYSRREPAGYSREPAGYSREPAGYPPRESAGYSRPDPYGEYAEELFEGDQPENAPETVQEPEAEEQPKGYAFKVRNLTKDYDGNIVLNDLSFDIPAGKIVGLLGPNGCGKTTLIKILAGLIHDYSGMIKVGGKPVGISSKASLAYLPDRTYFPDRFRTIDCINYFADFFADFDKIKAIEFAARFGLDLHQRVKTMSKGMQEKLQLLVVMSRAADIYLLDEPLGGVDPAARSVILDIIMSNYKKNATVVLSTHLVNDLEHSFDHVLMLGHGQVLVNTGIDTLRATGKSVEEIFKEVIGDAWEVE